MSAVAVMEGRRAGPKAQITADPMDLRRLGTGGARVDKWLRKFVVTPKGTGAHHPFRLRPWQRKLVNGLYGDPRPRSGLISIPRGNGKTTLAAALGLYALFGDGEDSPQVIVVASDERQATICRSIARRMVELSPELESRCHIFKDRIVTPHNDGSFVSLPADPDALHGWDPSLLIVDELHVVSELIWEAATSAAGKRERSLTLAISTPAASRDSLMWRLIEQNRVAPDPSFFVAEIGAPLGCEIDDERAWKIANPALNDFLYVDAMRSLLTTMRPASFRRLRLGQWSEDSEMWIAGDDWQACSDSLIIEPGTRVTLGFDGSVGDDSTALIGCTVDEKPSLFTIGVWDKPEGPLARDWRVPRDEVDEAVEASFARFDVAELACDPYAWRTEIEGWAKRHGADKVLEYPTNINKRMAPATERFYGAVRDRRLTHDGNPVLTRHVLAAVVKSSPSGDVISKDRRWSPRKIDAAVAAIIALDRATYHATAVPKRSGVVW
jgi:phage terminase large subunit-like protein